MASRITTPGTNKMTAAQSRIRSDIGNYPSSSTKFTVIHKRPISTIKTPPVAKSTKPSITINAHCRFAQHPVQTDLTQSTHDVDRVIVKCEEVSLHIPSDAEKRTLESSTKARKRPRRTLTRSLSADNLHIFQPPPAKRPFPVRIWFNKPASRLPVATAYWQDSPLYDPNIFVYIKLLEASQAHRYLLLQNRPRKYLHLTGGGVTAINIPPRKPEPTLPPMTIRLRPVAQKKEEPIIKPTPVTIRKNSNLPPPPPLISLRKDLREIPRQIVTVQPQDEPLELCKRRKHSADDESPPLPIRPEPIRPPKSPSNQPVNVFLVNGNIKRKIPAPIRTVQCQEPLDLATPSPTTAFRRMSLFDTKSPTSGSPQSPAANDNFRQRLLAVLQVLLEPRQLQICGHPHDSVDDVLHRFLNKAGVDPSKNDDVRENWIKFMRLCVKTEEAWRKQGWDFKSPDAILEEIYVQGDTAHYSSLKCHF